MLAVPFSVVGAVWLMYLLGYNVSSAAWVGMIARMGLMPIMWSTGTGADVIAGCCIEYSFGRSAMAVRLNITMDEDLYRRLKSELPPKRISAFIAEAVRCKLRPDKQTLDAAYKAASREGWRGGVAREWLATEGEGWPD